jgi:NADH-quinone oxidoreductase subunit D
MFETLQTDLTQMQIGPYHPLVPQGLKLRVALDGERISNVLLETGLHHRGLEKAMERQSWAAGIMYADRLDPEAAASGELAFCLAVEKVMGLEPPLRAKAIRLILTELNRVSSHLGFLARMARAVSATTALHFILRDRERLLDLFELLTGARYSFCFLRFGGVSADVTDGFIERVLEVCDLIRMRLKEYNDLLTFNQAFLLRVKGQGVISRELAERFNLSGPNARASGLNRDVRKNHPYSGYDRYDLTNPLDVISEGGTDSGDTHRRVLIRILEIEQSIDLLRQITDKLPSGEFQTPLKREPLCVPEGEGFSEVESPRGRLVCHVVSEGGKTPARVHFQGPSVFSLATFNRVCVGERLEDLSVIMAGLDISVSEVDK